MSEHIETRRKLKNIPRVSEFDAVLELCTLTDADKRLLRMHYIQGYDFRLIGDTLGFSEKTIKERHKKALLKLSQII